jgi:hypothetical protein
MTEEDELSELRDIWNERGYLKRSCRERKKEESEPEEYSDLEIESGEITDDSSDKDFDPNAREKKKKKKKKVKLKTPEVPRKKEPRPKKKAQIFKPDYSFDRVMSMQISHLAKFIEYEDEYDSYEEEASSVNEEFIEPPVQRKQKRSPTPEKDVIAPKKKRVIIYPWRPIGITSGGNDVEESYLTLRKPVNDVRLLLQLENQY